MNKNKIRIWGLPFAGGGGHSFRTLEPHLNSAVLEFRTLELPGRGQRYAEPLLKSAEALAEDCWQQMYPHLQTPYVLFGHSMGSLLAYLLCHKISAKNYPLPERVFLSGRGGPGSSRREAQRYLQSKAALKDTLRNYGGIDDQILNEDAYFDFFEPIIRADFQVVETWEYVPKAPLNIPATVLGGTEEDITLEEYLGWQDVFLDPIDLKLFPGGHFFLFEHAQEFSEYIEHSLMLQPELI